MEKLQGVAIAAAKQSSTAGFSDERKRFAKWFCMQDGLKEDDTSMDSYWIGWLGHAAQPPVVPDGYMLVPVATTPDKELASIPPTERRN